MTATAPHDWERPFGYEPVRSRDSAHIRQGLLDLPIGPTLGRECDENLTLAGRKPQASAESNP